MRRSPWFLSLLALVVGCGSRSEPPEPESRPPSPRLSEVELAEQLIGAPGVAGRRQAAEELGTRPALEPIVLRALGLALTDPDRWVREAAAKALREQGPLAAGQVVQLTTALRDEDDYVRWRAAEALGRVGSAAASAREELLRHAQDLHETEVVRAASQKALERIGGAGAPK